MNVPTLLHAVLLATQSYAAEAKNRPAKYKREEKRERERTNEGQ